MSFRSEVQKKYPVLASDDDESTFEMLNSWVFGDQEPLLESYKRGEWEPCGVSAKKLYRVLVLDDMGDFQAGSKELESWSKSEKASKFFIKKEIEIYDVKDQIVALVEKIIPAKDQIIDISETDVSDVYPEEEEVICVKQVIKKSNIKKIFKMKNGKLFEVKKA